VSAANSNMLLGATYNPIWYVGRQLVNGVNYLFIAEDIRSKKNKDKSIVGLVINVPPGENSIKGEGAKVDRIIESAELEPEIQAAFTTLEKSLIGVSFEILAAYRGGRFLQRLIVKLPLFTKANPNSPNTVTQRRSLTFNHYTFLFISPLLEAGVFLPQKG